MVKWQWLFAVCLLCLSIAEAKDSKKFGIGLEFGSFGGGGLNVKFKLDQTAAIQAGLAIDDDDDWDGKEWHDDNRWAIHGEYLKHSYGVIQVPKGKMPLYYGLGLGLAEDRWSGRQHWEDDDLALAGRIPLGIAYELPPSVPLDFFLELVPMLWIIPETDVGFDLGIGLRFWF